VRAVVAALAFGGVIQKVSLESGAVHSLALAYHRCAGLGKSGDASGETGLAKAVRAAVRSVFAQNPELCVRAMHDTFIGDEFVCLEVLEELRGMEKKRRGTFLILDAEHGLIEKALGSWAFHQRRALEDSNPEKSTAREVLRKLAEVVQAVLVKLHPTQLLKRMQDFPDAEMLQRVALAAIHRSPQLKLQVAVNYVQNGVVPVVIGCMQMLLRHFEAGESGDATPEIETAFRLLQDANLPADCWSYITYCLEVCYHVLSHWSATRISLAQKADVLDARAAPLLLAQGGLVDVLAEIVDPVAAGFELTAKPPASIVQKAVEVLQSLFEQNGHICLFCMQHYKDVRLMVSLGCESLAMEPLADFPDMQQQAVELLYDSFDRFAVQDERLGRKILKALGVLFESSYRLVIWFLQQHGLSVMQELQSMDAHVEAVRAVTRAPYWSSEDSPLLPEFVGLVAELLVGTVDGQGESGTPPTPNQPQRRVLDLTEAEELAAACMSCLLHLMLIDPTPPTVLHCLAQSLARQHKGGDESSTGAAAAVPADLAAGNSEHAVGAVMKIMQVFPSSDRVQMNCQHLLTSLLGE